MATPTARHSFRRGRHHGAWINLIPRFFFNEIPHWNAAMFRSEFYLHLEQKTLDSLRSGMAKGSKKKAKAMMLGLGLDSDGHKRVTTGPNFALVGGSKDTHEQMTEKAIKINEKLEKKGKSLETVTREEFDEIAQDVGLRPHDRKSDPPKDH
jgi:hypothetical protein